MKTIIILSLAILGATACNDRKVKVEDSSGGDAGAEARTAACEGLCERADTCLPEIGREGVEDTDACVQSCLTEGPFFREHYRECWDEAVAKLECENSHSCDDWLPMNLPDVEKPWPPGETPCSGPPEDPGPSSIHGTCIANVNNPPPE
jgi:hypothetical protein